MTAAVVLEADTVTEADATNQKSVSVAVVAADPAWIPRYASQGAAGADLFAALQEPLEVVPGGRHLVPTGIFAEIPQGYEGQVRPRSGLAINHGITVLNSPGTIDSDYRGEISVPLINLGGEPVTIVPGMRIAQLVIAPVIQVTFVHTKELGHTQRGTGGFGSTGTL